MAEQTSLNPMLQIMAVARAPQGKADNAAPAPTGQTAAETPSFSQVLRSASERTPASASKPTESGKAQPDGKTTDPATVSQDSTTADSLPPDVASQAMAALLALQSALANQPNAAASPTAATPTTSAITSTSDASTNVLASSAVIPDAAAKTEVPATEGTAANSASIAVLPANPEAAVIAARLLANGQNSAAVANATADDSQSSRTSGRIPETFVAQSQQTEAGKREDASKDMLQEQRLPVTDASALRAKETGSNTEATNSANTFTAELNNAQAAYGIKTEARLETQASTQHTVSTPVTAHNWADEVGSRLHWVATKDNGRADLVLNPPQMGKIEVSINLNGDQASASFTAANPATREALQDAMPRLREVLADAGIQLGQANVSAGGSGQAQAEQNSARSNAQAQAWQNSGGSADIQAVSIEKRTTRGNGLIDLFA